MAAREKPEVSVPSPGEDQPRLGRLGLVAAACFAAGALWPALAGVDLAPRPPGLSKTEEPELEPPPPPPPTPDEHGDDAELPAVSSVKSAPQVTRDELVRVEKFVVTSCGNDDDWQESDCDRPPVDGAVEEAIERLAHCESAAGTSGTLSLGVELDFKRGHVTRLRSGKSTSLSKERAEALLACADSVVVGTPLPRKTVPHERYWAYYLARFVPPGSPIDANGVALEAQIVPMSGQATVGWKTAVVRKQPSTDADVQSRLLYGTRVEVSARSGPWYRVELPGADPGWVHGEALGL